MQYHKQPLGKKWKQIWAMMLHPGLYYASTFKSQHPLGNLYEVGGIYFHAGRSFLFCVHVFQQKTMQTALTHGIMHLLGVRDGRVLRQVHRKTWQYAMMNKTDVSWIYQTADSTDDKMEGHREWCLVPMLQQSPFLCQPLTVGTLAPGLFVMGCWQSFYSAHADGTCVCVFI